MATPTPAWKRLGLKLKYARDEPDRPPTAVSTKTNEHNSELIERPAKRRRVLRDKPADKSGPDDADSSSSRVRESNGVNVTNGSTTTSNFPVKDSQQPRQRKKSVTFSEETKQDDGDSRTTIDFPAGSPGSTPKKSKDGLKGSPEDERARTLTSAVGNTNSVAAENDATPTKQASKAKTGKKSKTSRSSGKDKSSSALDYLSQHRLERNSWKFNKIIDVWILNHALDTQAIPSTHVLALAGYVRGLPEKAASRARLIKECKEALPAAQLDADTIEEDRKLFLEFVESHKGSLEDKTRLQEFLQAHSRPAVLLWALNETIRESTTSGQQSVPLMKKKKSRTAAPIDISSSSESDSDSDSSDDSSDSEARDKVGSSRGTAKAVNGSAVKDDTSSSGTSSSEDDSEDSSSSDTSSSDESDNDKKLNVTR